METQNGLNCFLRFFKRYNRYIKVSVISVLGLILATMPTELFNIEGLTIIQQRVIAIFVWAALMWIMEAVPAWTTSLLIIVISLLTISNSSITPLISGLDEINRSQLVGYKVIMGTFADQTVMLFMGGFVLALVASKSGVDITLARAMLKPFGSKPYVERRCYPAEQLPRSSDRGAGCGGCTEQRQDLRCRPGRCFHRTDSKRQSSAEGKELSDSRNCLYGKL